MEILGYCLIQWLCSRLPWEDRLTNKEYVKKEKNKAMDDIPGFMKKCFGAEVPMELQKYMEEAASMAYPAEPNYDSLRARFNAWLKKHGQLSTGLDFSKSSAVNGHAASPKKNRDRSSIDEFSSPPPPPAQKRARKAPSSKIKGKAEESVTPRGKRSKLDSSVEESLTSPTPASRRKAKAKVKEEMDSYVTEDESLGVGPLSPVAKVKVKAEVRARSSPRSRVKRITKDVYSPPINTKTVPKRRPCKNPVDVAIQTSPWLKKTIKRSRKTAPE